MKGILTQLERWWFPTVSALLLVIIFSIVYRNDLCERQWKNESRTHTLIIDLDDDASWEAMATIQANLERKTYQPVYNELIDPQRNIYKIKVKVPPQHARSLWDWLRGRDKVHDIRIDDVENMGR